MKAQITIGARLLIIISVVSISNANIENSTNEVKLSIADNRLLYGQCCWAAISQTILQYYKVYKSQDDIINWAGGQHVLNYTCNHENPKSIDKILEHFANIPASSDSCADNYIDINKIKSEIDHDRPIVILLGEWYGPPCNYWDNSNEGLFGIIYGYIPTSPIHHIEWQNPCTGYEICRYDTLVNELLQYDRVLGCNIYLKWQETLTLGGSNTNPSGPNPPFNPANQNTISQRVIPALITTIFQTILKKVP